MVKAEGRPLHQTLRAGDIVAYRAFRHEEQLIVHAYVHSKQSPKFTELSSMLESIHCLLMPLANASAMKEGHEAARAVAMFLHFPCLQERSETIGRIPKSPHFCRLNDPFRSDW